LPSTPAGVIDERNAAITVRGHSGYTSVPLGYMSVEIG
jgi:hypothetical protein